MHSNADITFQLNSSKRLCETILLTANEDTNTDSNDEESNNLDKTVLDIIKKLLESLPEILKRSDASKSVKERGNDGMISIYSTFLFHEIEKFSKLIIKMNETLVNLQDAIKGIALMSSELDRMFNLFLVNTVPPNWKKLSFLSLKPLGSWYDDLLKRVEYLRNWLTVELPIHHWLTV